MYYIWYLVIKFAHLIKELNRIFSITDRKNKLHKVYGFGIWWKIYTLDS